MVCFLCFDPKPPEGAVRNPKYAAMMQYQSNPNAYAVSLMDAPGKEPLACVATCLTVCCGLPACYYRKKALETVGRGVEDYVCCQGYFPGCCGCEPATQCQGQMAGLLLEGCCCPTLSLSFTRILLMDVLKLQPDPVDYQMIAFSNACQVLACICDVLSMFIEDLRDAADVIDCIADLVTFSVAGCMGAQIEHELKSAAPLAQQMNRAA